MSKDQIILELGKILQESIRIYETNGHGTYEAGRIDGVKWCIEAVQDSI